MRQVSGPPGTHGNHTALGGMQDVRHGGYQGNAIADAALDQLLPQKDEIEKLLGESLQWNPSPEKRDKIIAVYREADLNDRKQWPEYCDGLVDHVAKFRKVFGPRIKSLNINTTNDEQNE